MNEFSKVAVYKINTQKFVAFLSLTIKYQKKKTEKIITFKTSKKKNRLDKIN